jgi:hypothetical protein
MPTLPPRSATEDDDAAGVRALDPALRNRLNALIDEGRDYWNQFDIDVRQHEFHPFVPANYDRVLRTLLPLRAPGLRFLEWGSATGVITIIADLLGFDACGIELDPQLVEIARELAGRYQSGARFAAGSFLPAGYEFRTRDGDARQGSIGKGPSGYLELRRPLEDFDLVFGYPWSGEEPLMRDLMRRYGGEGARLLIHGATDEIAIHEKPGRG